MADKLTLEDMRNVDAAFKRGVESVLRPLADGALLLRRADFNVADHDKIHDALSRWLHRDNFGLRAPGVCDNLFRLSDYLSGKAPVPSREVLLFLHAYIFALESLSSAKAKTRDEEEKRRKRRDKKEPPYPRDPKPRPLRERSY